MQMAARDRGGWSGALLRTATLLLMAVVAQIYWPPWQSATRGFNRSSRRATPTC